jgi:hypothetical protein
MKNKILLLPLLLFGLLIAVQYGCEPTTDESCESFNPPQCSAPDDATVCCDGDQCYYTYQGQTYPDTDQGMEDLIKDMCGTTANLQGIKMLLSEQTKRLLIEAQSCSECD